MEQLFVPVIAAFFVGYYYLLNQRMKQEPQKDPKAKWVWIHRGVETLLKKRIKKGNFCILIRGRRRIGKTSTINRILDQIQRTTVRLQISHDTELFLKALGEELRKRGLPCEITSTSQLKERLPQLIREGHVFLFDEIQRANEDLQMALQEIVDTLAQDFEIENDQWRGLIVMDSYPRLVDKVITSSSRPLYQRFEEYHISEFSNRALNDLFRSFSITSPWTMLRLYSLFGGLPFFYRICAKEDLLRNDLSTRDILNMMYASGCQHMGTNLKRYLGEEIGDANAMVLRALAQNAAIIGNKQIDNIMAQTKQKKDEVVRALEDMMDLGIVCEHISVDDGKLISYQISDAALKFALHQNLLGNLVECPGYVLNVPFDEEKIQQYEGQVLELWIRKIIEERLSKSLAPFPHDDFKGLMVWYSIF